MFTRTKGERSRGGPVDRERDGAGQGEHVGAAAHHNAARHGREQRLDQAVLGPRGELHGDLDTTRGALHGTDEGPGRGRPERVRVAVVAGGQRIEDDERARGGGPGRLQHHRLVDVTALGIGRAVHRPEREVPGPGVEQPPEHRRRVEPGSTQPVHRARAADERGCVAVGQEGVVGNGDAHRLLLCWSF